MNDTQLVTFGHAIILEQKCTECNGLGTVMPKKHTDDKPYLCEKCNGTGYLLTDNGKELARFIQHQFGLIPKQYIDQMSPRDKEQE